MSVQTPNQVSVTTNPTFGELFAASLLLIRYRGWLAAIHAVFPLFGLFLLTTPFTTGDRLGPVEISLGLVCLSFTPLVTALAVWSARRRNRLAQGPFTYVFDAEGMHTSGSAFRQTIRWSAIPRVRQSKRFLLIFVSPVRAQCIPLRSLTDGGDLGRLRAIISEHTELK